MPTDIAQQHHALIHKTGFAVFPRSQVQMTGNDRVQLLHGMCTNDIKRLRPGQGCEAFLTNVQGKIIGHVNVFCHADSLVLESVAGEAPNIIRSLDRYVIREDVRFTDRSMEWQELLVSGTEAPALLQQILASNVPQHPLDHCEISFQGTDVSLRHTTFAGANSFHLSSVPTTIDVIHAALIARGGFACDDETVEIVRIEAGTPIYGRDITIDNLPQEVDRNDMAISFTKGCYLGQETVARIDALGHVNRVLRGLRFDGGDVPAGGTEIETNGKTVAKITSACFSVRLQSVLAFAYVRRGHDQPGTRISTQFGTAEVIELPVGQ